MKLLNIKGIIFDMDGTLIDSLIAWDDIWSAVNEKFIGVKDFKPSEELDKKVRTTHLDGCAKYIIEEYDIKVDVKEVATLVGDVVKEFYQNKVLLKDGAIEFLKHCQELGIKMCIASGSSSEFVKMVIKRLGIDKYFSGVFSCADAGKAKDEPDVYLEALEHLGTNLDETWVFEDSHVAIMTADKAGFKTVGIYDKCNYGFDEIKKIATECVFENETLEKFI